MHRVVYLGDGELSGAAGYLYGVLTQAGFGCVHRPPDRVREDRELRSELGRADCIVLSDLPSSFLDSESIDALHAAASRGCGLLMIGGWGSFGSGGYGQSAVAELLPVTIDDTDDRVNCFAPCMIRRVAPHPTIDGLPFDRPPGIGGYNRVVADKDATVVLEALRFSAAASGEISFTRLGDPDPLLVVGSNGPGRCAAYTGDVAPHWVGGLVDWGSERVTASVGNGSIEVGNHYARLFTTIVGWLASGST